MPLPLRSRFPIAIAALALSAAPPLRADIVFSQPPQTVPGSTSGAYSVHHVEHVADDFTITQPASLATIRWWGFVTSFSGDPAGFTVQILDDSGPSGAPGAVLAEWTPALAGITATPTGLILGFSQEIRYDLTLPAPLPLAPQTRYWLFIAADTPPANLSWFWRTSLSGNGTIAGALSFGPDWAVYNSQIYDHAFELTSIPAPCAGIAIVCSLSFGTPRRRRLDRTPKA